MKRTMLFVVAAMLVVGGGVAYSAMSPTAKLAKQDRIWGGGQFGPGCDVGTGTICIPNARDLSVDAHADADGSEAVGNSSYRNFTRRSVTCLGIDGNHAVIGGIIITHTLFGGADVFGWYYVQYFVDRGDTVDANIPDLASFTIFGPPTDPTFPVGFPDVCPSATGTVDLPAVYWEMTGDIAIQDSTAN
jgi:hypothetical protein